VPLREEVAKLKTRLDLKVIHVLEEPPMAWTGEQGWITREMLDRYLPPERTRYEYFICGPVPMTQAMEGFLYELGIPMSSVHIELFDMV
jgi:ferredoxin-NADP reductase